jgi:hypothetical protein
MIVGGEGFEFGLIADVTEDYDAAFIVKAVNSHDKLVAALESIAGWRKVNISGEYEHGLRDIIRAIADCADAALSASQ